VNGSVRAPAPAARQSSGGLGAPRPTRTLEATLRGGALTEPPAALARIDGYDRAAYQVCACRAVEAACRAAVPESIETLRRLLCCTAWIEGHTAHIHLAQAPDFLGYSDAAGLTRCEPAAATRELALSRVGAELADALGGPSNVRVGGFRAAPDRARLATLLPRLQDALDAALQTVRWVSGFSFPESVLDVPLIALDDPLRTPTAHGHARYPLDGGDGVLATSGLGFPLIESESFVSRTRAARPEHPRAVLRGSKAALTGPLARYALAGPALNPLARRAAQQAGLAAQERNPFRTILIRAVELVHAIEETATLLERYEQPDPPFVAITPRPGRGLSASETPSGLLYQRYDLLADGRVGAVRIIGPTELNRTALELDQRRALRDAIRRNPAMDKAARHALSARIARNYGPTTRATAWPLDSAGA
jgi:sulfhydrogenase subunit alpha